MINLWWAFLLLFVVVLIYFFIGSYAALTLTKVGDHPQYKNDPGTYGKAYEQVRFPSRVDNIQIAGWFLPNPGAHLAMILVHGRDASKQNAISGELPKLAVKLHDQGLAVLLIDLRGHGESEGKRYTFGVQEKWDVLGAVDYLLVRGCYPGQMGVLGISLGGAAVIGAAVEEPAIGAVVVESTFADINELIVPNWKKESGLPMLFLPGVFYMWRLTMGFDLRTVIPAIELNRISPRPILILHSQADEVVDVSHAYALKAAAPGAELVVFEDCSHAELFRDRPEDYIKALGTFLDKRWKMGGND